MAHRGLISAALFALGSIGCGDYTLDPLPLNVTITATPTSSPINQDIVFEVRAQGGQLLGLIVDYGDGVTQDEDLRSSRTAEATLRHAYTTPGVYNVTAGVADAILGDKQASVTVTIQ